MSPPVAPAGVGDADEFTLLWSKSKVYVHPTPYARDNVAGYIAVLRKGAYRPMANATNIYLAFMPEKLLEERDELGIFVEVEMKEGTIEAVKEVVDQDSFLVTAPPALESVLCKGETSASTGQAVHYAFSFALSTLYSFTLHPPTFSSWYGTMVLSLTGGVAMPTLHFHDDESQSTILGLQRATQGLDSGAASISSGGSGIMRSSAPVAMTGEGTGGGSEFSVHSSPSCTWGGDELLHQLRRYTHVIKSVIQSNLFLVNPSRADLETHSTPLFEDDAIDRQPGGAGDGSAYERLHAGAAPGAPGGRAHRANGGTGAGAAEAADVKMDPLVLWAKSTRLNFLSKMAQVTQTARQATQQVLSHPLAKPYVGHLPGPVQSFAQAGPFPLGPISDAEWGRIAQQSGTGEYDSARVYLAKWARLVAEEGERNKRNEDAMVTASSASSSAAAVKGKESAEEEVGQLGVFELLAKSADVPRPPTTRVSGSPITLSEWNSLFDNDTGRPLHSEPSMKQRVFAHGLADLPTRREAWPFLLGAVPWQSSTSEREQIWKTRSEQYWSIKKEWQNNPALLEREDVLEQRHRIRVDCLRTDRSHPMFKAVDAATQTSGSPALMSASIVQEKEAGHSAATSNDNVVRLGEILLTFGMWESGNGKLGGYVQGMSDLCSLLYIVCDGDEVRTFWCFIGLMERMGPNFYADQSGMKKLLLQLQKLIAVMDPALYAHLDKADSLNLFFCFRWLLICFKREFPLDDLMKLWECVWAAEFPSGEPGAHRDGTARDGIATNFSLFVALAVLESHRDSTMRYLDHFDELLQYMNGLSGNIDVDSTIAQAEVLALALRVLFERKSEADEDDVKGAPTAIHARLTDDMDELRSLVF